MNCRIIISCLLLTVLIFAGGCEVAAILATPSSHENLVEPEYDLEAANKEAKGGVKVAVIVDQASHIRSQMNLRYKLTSATNALLVNKLDIEPENVVEYKTIAKMRNSVTGFSMMKPHEIGKRFECDYVLLVTIIEYDLYRLPEKDLFTGTSKATFSLYSVSQQKRLSPKEGPATVVEVEVEIERGLEASVDRIERATSYCIVRNLYPIPHPEYRIMDEKKNVSWDWE